MKIEKFKNLIRNNLGLKILAVVFAILVWLYVFHAENHRPPSEENNSGYESQR